MDLIVVILGAYLAWRLLAKDSSKPSQEPLEIVEAELPQPPPQTPAVYLNQNTVFRVNRFDSLINAVTNTMNIPPGILKALIYQQSGGDDAARFMQPDSEYGYGLTQITCGRARQLAANLDIEGVVKITDCLRLEEPINSIYYGAAYLRALYTGNWQDALARYFSPTESLIPRQDAIKKAALTIAVANAWT